MSSKNHPEGLAPSSSPHGLPSWSLAARLTAWYAGTGFLLILLATGFLYYVLATNLDREDDELLEDKVQSVTALLNERPEKLDLLRQEFGLDSSVKPNLSYQLRLLDEHGRTLLESPGMREDLPTTAFPEPPPHNGGPGQGAELHGSTGRFFRVITARVAVELAGSAGKILHVALDRTGEEKLLATYRNQLWLVLALAMIVCTLAGHQIARRGLRPLAAMSRTAARIRSTTLNERMEPSGMPSELFVLAGSFNEMLVRLEESFQRLEQFSGDIAHELRTPVNNLRGEAEVALGRTRTPDEYREVLSSCLEECVRLSGLIDSLLFLARAESPNARLTRESVKVSGELAAIAAMYEGAASEAGVTLAVTADAGIVASLDRTLFQRAVANLVSNALTHTPQGGKVTLNAFPGDRELCVEVADTGSGIAPEHLPKIWDRFYRADAARSTSGGHVGLGLAIVKSIVSLHGGTATIDSRVGQGTRVRLTFLAVSPIENRVQM